MVRQRNAVFLVDAQRVDVWHHAEAGPAGVTLQKFRAAIEQADVSAKPIDDESAQQITLTVIQQRERAGNCREDASAIDIRNQDSLCSNRSGERQIDEVSIFQVHFGNTAGAFQDDDIDFRRQALKAL